MDESDAMTKVLAGLLWETALIHLVERAPVPQAAPVVVDDLGLGAEPAPVAAGADGEPCPPPVARWA